MLFSLIAFFFFEEDWYYEVGNGENLCNSLWHCFISSLYYVKIIIKSKHSFREQLLMEVQVIIEVQEEAIYKQKIDTTLYGLMICYTGLY